MKIIPLNATAKSAHIVKDGNVVGFKCMVTVEVEIHDLKEDLLKTPLDAVDRIVAEAYAEHTNNLKSDRTGETTLAGAITGN